MKSDIIINQHAFPSKMTIGMLIDSMCGKLQISKDCAPYEAAAEGLKERRWYPHG